MPFSKTQEWLAKESELGSLNPQQAVLATANLQNVPHSRMVAIREITSEGILFFTQRGTRKYNELLQNPHASMTFWLAYNNVKSLLMERLLRCPLKKI